MKEEITRIMRLVQEGKLSPEDGADLIDALQESPDEPVAKASTSEQVGGSEVPPPPPNTDGTPPPPPSSGSNSSNPFASFIDAVEKTAKEISTNVDWNEVSNQVRKGVDKGTELLKKVASDIKDGKINFGFNEDTTRRYEHPLVISEAQTLRLDIPKGDIKVNCNAAESKIVANMTFHADSKEAAEEMANEFVLMTEESDHFVLLKLAETRDYSGSFEISVAHGVSVDIRTSSGDVDVNGAIGSNKISVTAGDVKLSDFKGSLELSMTSGDLNAKNSDFAALSVEMKSGDIHLEKVQGVITMRSGSGDIVVSEAGGKSLAVETISGDITVAFANGMNGQTDLRTVNGEITIGLPSDADCRVKLSAIQGEVSSRLNLQDEFKAKGSLTGKLGAGMGSLDVSTVSGDISLSALETHATAP